MRYYKGSMNNCINCGAETTNPKFCSRSCSTSYNNTKSPKRKIEYNHSCNKCKKPLRKKRKLCKDCNLKGKDLTLGEARYELKHSPFALIRSRARSSVKNEPQVCEYCGYAKHVEVCHIKSISEFTEDTLLSEINSRDNLKILCPNCHWEFDNLETR